MIYFRVGKPQKNFVIITIYFFPNLEAIYTNDEERRISFSDAKLFGDNLKQTYESLADELIEIPCVSPEERAGFILTYSNSKLYHGLGEFGSATTLFSADSFGDLLNFSRLLIDAFT